MTLPDFIDKDFFEIENDSLFNLEKTDQNYEELLKRLSDFEKKHPFIIKLFGDRNEIRLTAEEHEAFLQYMRMRHDVNCVERKHLYKQGGSDSIAYLKMIKLL